VDSSAHKLSKYVSSIFPEPPASLFERSLDQYDWTLSLLSIDSFRGSLGDLLNEWGFTQTSSMAA
jgi:hypothetical protein